MQAVCFMSNPATGSRFYSLTYWNTLRLSSVSPQTVFYHYGSFARARIKTNFYIPMNYEPTPNLLYTETYSCVSLHKCVHTAITDLRWGTNTIINDVNPGILVSTNKAKLSEITGLLLKTIVSNCENSNIHLSAKLVGNVTLLHIRSNDAGSNVAITENIRAIESIAKTLGGCVTINSGKTHGLAMAFTFINH